MRTTRRHGNCWTRLRRRLPMTFEASAMATTTLLLVLLLPLALSGVTTMEESVLAESRNPLKFLDVDFDPTTTRLAAGFCSAASANVCAYQNAVVLAKRTRHAMEQVNSQAEFDTFARDFADSTTYSVNEYFSVRICNVATATCVVNGNQASGLPNDPTNLKGNGTTWQEHIDTFLSVPPLTGVLRGTMNWQKGDGDPHPEPNYTNPVVLDPVADVIHQEASALAKAGGGWMRLPFVTCEKLAFSRITADCTLSTRPQDKGKLALSALMYVAPVPATTISSAFAFPPGVDAASSEYYVASAIIDSEPVLPMLKCSSVSSNLCAPQKVCQQIVSRAYRALASAKTWPLFETVLKELTYSSAYKEGTPSDFFYVFVGDYTDLVVSHGANDALVGRPFADIIDPARFPFDGTYLHQLFVNATLTSSTGWTSYQWPSSGCGSVSACPLLRKASYVSRIEVFGRKMYIGAGYNHVRETPKTLGTPDGAACSPKQSLSCGVSNIRMLAGHTLSSFYVFGLDSVISEINQNVADYSINDGTPNKFSVVFVHERTGKVMAYNGLDPNIKVNQSPPKSNTLDGMVDISELAKRGGGYLVEETNGVEQLSLVIPYFHEPTSESYYIKSSIRLTHIQHQQETTVNPQCTPDFDTLCSRKKTIEGVGWAEGLLLKAAANSTENATQDVYEAVHSIALQRKAGVQISSDPNSTNSNTNLLVFDEFGVLYATTDPYFEKYRYNNMAEIISAEKISSASPARLLEQLAKAYGGGWYTDAWVNSDGDEMDYNFFAGNLVCREVGEFKCSFVVGLVAARSPEPPPYRIIIGSQFPHSYLNLTDSADYSKLVSNPSGTSKTYGNGFLQSLLNNVLASEKTGSKGTSIVVDSTFAFSPVSEVGKLMHEVSDEICTELITNGERALGVIVVKRRVLPNRCFGDGAHLLSLRKVYSEELVTLARTEEDNPSEKNPMRFFVSLVQYESVLLVCIIFILMGITACIIWTVEHIVNESQFPKGFLDGIDDAMWWCMVTASTVGYGDKAPKSNAGRLIAAAWMMLGLFFWSLFTAQVTYQLETRVYPLSELKDAGYEKRVGALANLKDPISDEMSTKIGTASNLRECDSQDLCVKKLRKKNPDLDAVVMTMAEASVFKQRGKLGEDLVFVGEGFQKENVHGLYLVASKMKGGMSTALENLDDEEISDLLIKNKIDRLSLASFLAWTTPKPEPEWPFIVQLCAGLVFCFQFLWSLVLFLFGSSGVWWVHGQRIFGKAAYQRISAVLLSFKMINTWASTAHQDLVKHIKHNAATAELQRWASKVGLSPRGGSKTSTPRDQPVADEEGVNESAIEPFNGRSRSPSPEGKGYALVHPEPAYPNKV